MLRTAEIGSGSRPRGLRKRSLGEQVDPVPGGLTLSPVDLLKVAAIDDERQGKRVSPVRFSLHCQ